LPHSVVHAITVHCVAVVDVQRRLTKTNEAARWPDPGQSAPDINRTE